MTRHSINQYFVFSFYLLLLLVIGIVALGYLVSPLRDPSFVPQTSLTPGATVDWLNPERYWMALVYTLAILLANNVTILAWLLLHTNRQLTTGRDFLALIVKLLGLVGLWIFTAYGTWLFLLWFLLEQWIVD